MFWLGEELAELQRRDPELGEPRVVVLDEDPLFLGAEDLDLRDLGDQEHLVAHVLGDVLELGVAEAVAGHRHDRPEDVAELVVDEGPANVLGELAPGVVDLAPELVPDGTHVRRSARGC